MFSSSPFSLLLFSALGSGSSKRWAIKCPSANMFITQEIQTADWDIQSESTADWDNQSPGFIPIKECE